MTKLKEIPKHILSAVAKTNHFTNSTTKISNITGIPEKRTLESDLKDIFIHRLSHRSFENLTEQILTVKQILPQTVTYAPLASSEMLVALLRNFFIRDHSYCHVDFMRRLPKIIADSKNEIWNTVRYQRRIIAMYLEMGRRLSRRLVREAPLCKYSHGIKDELEIVAKNIVNTDSVARTVEPNVVEHNIHPESNSSKKLLGLQIKLGGPQKADLAMKLNHIKGKPSFLNESYLRETSNSQILTHFGVYGLKVRLNYGLASSLPKQTYKLAADYNKTPFLMKKKDHQVSYYE